MLLCLSYKLPSDDSRVLLEALAMQITLVREDDPDDNILYEVLTQYASHDGYALQLGHALARELREQHVQDFPHPSCLSLTCLSDALINASFDILRASARLPIDSGLISGLMIHSHRQMCCGGSKEQMFVLMSRTMQSIV